MLARTEVDVKDYIKTDRQWLRVHRLAHAQYQKRIAKSDVDKRFWQGVINANKRGGSK